MAHSTTRRRRQRHREVSRREVFYAILALTLVCLVAVLVLACIGTDPELQKSVSSMCSHGWQMGLGAILALIGVRQSH